MANHEKLKNMAGAIQSFIVSIAIVIGGGWGLYKFTILEDVVSLDIQIKASQIVDPTSSRPVVLVVVKVKNNGSRHIRLDLSKNPLLIQRVHILDSGELVAKNTWKPLFYSKLMDNYDDYTFIQSQGVAPKSIKAITFLQELDVPGTYFINFQSPIQQHHEDKLLDSISEQQARAKRLDAEYSGSAWSATSYISIIDPVVYAAQQIY